MSWINIWKITRRGNAFEKPILSYNRLKSSYPQRLVTNYPAPSQPRERQLPNQRWFIHPPKPELAKLLAKTTGLSPLLGQVMLDREVDSPEAAQAFLDPDSIALPAPIEEFPDLPKSLDLLQSAISQKHKIAICGDYDADGMTSTALLIRTFRHLGAIADCAIPSRMREGYGINQRIVEDFHAQGVRLILTVDNGIAAHQPIARARELGLAVIITDHHDLPPTLPAANAILNPKLIAETSPLSRFGWCRGCLCFGDISGATYGRG